MSRYFARLAQRSGMAASAPRPPNRMLEQHVETYAATGQPASDSANPVMPPHAAPALQPSGMLDAGRAPVAGHPTEAFAPLLSPGVANLPAASSATAAPVFESRVQAPTQATAFMAPAAPFENKPGAPVAAQPHAAMDRQAMARPPLPARDAVAAAVWQPSPGIEPVPLLGVAASRPAGGPRRANSASITPAPQYTVAAPLAAATATPTISQAVTAPQVHIGRIELAVHAAPAAPAPPAIAPQVQPSAARPDAPFNPHRHYLRGG
jgi:hypothetical protein